VGTSVDQRDATSERASSARSARIDADGPTGGLAFRDPGAIPMLLTNVRETTYPARLVELKQPDR
jgi:hypothetical protein